MSNLALTTTITSVASFLLGALWSHYAPWTRATRRRAYRRIA